jgi:hypothetical protein
LQPPRTDASNIFRSTPPGYGNYSCATSVMPGIARLPRIRPRNPLDALRVATISGAIASGKVPHDKSACKARFANCEGKPDHLFRSLRVAACYGARFRLTVPRSPGRPANLLIANFER